MVGLISEPAGTAALQREGTADFPSDVWDRVDPLGSSKLLARGIGTAQAELGTVDDFGRELSPPEPTLTPDELVKTYGDNGLKFTTPLPASVAQSMHDAKADELMRQDAARRQPDGFGSSLGNFAAGMLDPVNVAAGFIPVLGEARVAGMLARAGLSGLGDDVLAGVAERGAAAIPGIGTRMAVRAATGAAGGVLAQAPLVGARYALSGQEQADYSATDAMMDIAVGGLLGGGLHTAAGGIGDLVASRFRRTGAAAVVDQDTGARETALQGAIAAVAEDRPVEVAPSIDIAAADSASREMATWVTQQQRIAAESDAALAAAPDAGAATAAAADGLQGLRQAADGVSPAPGPGGSRPGSPESLLSFLIRNGGLLDDKGELASMDAAKGRIGLVRKPISGPAKFGETARDRGMTLDHARTVAEETGYLPEGSDIGDLLNAVSDELHGRKVYVPHEAAEYQGAVGDRSGGARDIHALDDARSRVLDAEEDLGARLSPDEVEHATELTARGMHPHDAVQEAGRATEMAARSGEADRASRIQATGIEGQTAAIQALAEGTVRRYAAKIGVPLRDDEVAGVARRVLTAPAGRTEAETRAALADIAGRKGRAAAPVTAEEIRSALGRAETAWSSRPEAVMDPSSYTAWGDAMEGVPADVQSRFQVHGTRDIGGLLSSGIDQDRPFHSGPPLGGDEGVIATRHHNPFLLLSDRDASLRDTGVRNMVLNGVAGDLRPMLEGSFPGVRFMSSDEAAEFMRSGAVPAASLPDVLRAAQARLAAERASALQDVMGSDAVAHATGRPLPDDAAAAALAEAAARLPADAPASLDTARLAAAEEVIRQAREAGALDARSEAELAEADAEHQQAQTLGQAIRRAASCLVRSV